MNIKTFAFGCVALAASVVWAALVEFPKAGGDLASASDWGGALPDATNTVNLTRAGTYTLSDDVSFAGLQIPTGGSTLAFGSKAFTLTGKKFAFEASNSGTTVIDGSTLRFSDGSASEFYGVYNASGCMVLTNGCVVTNVGTFYGGAYSMGSVTKITGGSKVYAGEVRINNNTGSENVLEISGGGELHVVNRFYHEANSTAGSYGGQKLLVTGKGSLFSQKNNYMLQLGFNQNDDVLEVTDGASFVNASGGVNVGGASGGSNAKMIVSDNATMSLGSIGVNGANGRMLVANGASLTVPTIKFAGSGNEMMISNATLYSSASKVSARSMLGSNSTTSNNTLRVYGPDASFSMTPTYDVFGNGHHDKLALEGGAKWTQAINNLMTNTHHSVFSVSGAGTRYGTAAGSGNFYFGTCKDDLKNPANSVSNVVEISDGALFEVCRIVIAGQDNRLVVSNATINLCDDSVGLRVGYNNAATKNGNRVVLQGPTPKIYSAAGTGGTARNAFYFQNNSTLRFEIPEEGYAEGHVPIELAGCSFHLEVSNNKVEIDCDKFVEKTGGKLHLIHSKDAISTSSSNNIKSYLMTKVALPAGARIIVDGGDVYLKSPRRTGLVLIIR